jgi:hypothetical protein
MVVTRSTLSWHKEENDRVEDEPTEKQYDSTVTHAQRRSFKQNLKITSIISNPGSEMLADCSLNLGRNDCIFIHSTQNMKA